MLLYTIDRVPRLLLSDGPRLSLFGFLSCVSSSLTLNFFTLLNTVNINI